MSDEQLFPEVMPQWLFYEFLGEDDECNPIVWETDIGCYWVGDDEDGDPIFIEIP